MSDAQLAQRYALAAELCNGLRVLDLGDAPGTARAPLEASAAHLAVGGTDSEVDVVVALAEMPGADERERMLAEVRRRADQGARVLVVFESPAGRARSPRVQTPAEDAARELADGVPGSRVLRQFAAEGSLIGPLDGAAPRLELRAGDLRDEDAAALIVVSGFGEDAVTHARASLSLVAAPVLTSYVRSLETAHAELLRANRELMRERLGRDGSAAASLLNAQQQLGEMKAIAKEHEEHVHRVHAWYDAPRYHLVDRIRTALTKLPGFAGSVRFLWSLISTRAESPALDAKANPQPDIEPADDAETPTERVGVAAADDRLEPAETTDRLEE